MINTKNDLSYGVTKGFMKSTFDEIERQQEQLYLNNLPKSNGNYNIEEVPFDKLETISALPSSINLVEINRQYRQQICTSLGVPSSFIVDDSVVKVFTNIKICIRKQKTYSIIFLYIGQHRRYNCIFL